MLIGGGIVMGTTARRNSKWIWVSLSYATFGIEVADNKVVDAAPVAHWMIGKDTHFIRQWITKKQGTWKVLKGIE